MPDLFLQLCNWKFDFPHFEQPYKNSFHSGWLYAEQVDVSQVGQSVVNGVYFAPCLDESSVLFGLFKAEDLGAGLEFVHFAK